MVKRQILAVAHLEWFSGKQVSVVLSWQELQDSFCKSVYWNYNVMFTFKSHFRSHIIKVPKMQSYLGLLLLASVHHFHLFPPWWPICLIYHLINQKLKTFLCISTSNIQSSLRMAMLGDAEYFALEFVLKIQNFKMQTSEKDLTG